MLTQSELDYRAWLDEPDFPHLKNDHQVAAAKRYLDNIKGHDWQKPLYAHQYAAITKVIFHGEKLGRWDSLLDIVTGGGKTVIMAGLIAYFWQVRGHETFLILVPNTIVRERVKDDFEQSNPSFAYREFPFFFNGFVKAVDRISCKVLRSANDAASIRGANIVVANIHQLYEGRQSKALETLLSDSVDSLIILNDEAHNAAADQYREVLKLLRHKTASRIDLTATPFRLDKQDLDTPTVYEYHVQQAMRDGVVKQTIVTKPDIDSVKLQYEEWDENNQLIRTLDAVDMPWEHIEKELQRGGAVRFVTAKTARRQQLQIAQSTLDYQRKCVPAGIDGKRIWEPLMLVVALSQKDAWEIFEALQKAPFGYKREEILLVHSKQDELENKKAFLLGRKNADGLSKDDAELWGATRAVRVVIAVSMLREGWDVRNIAVICLFRKFSYTKKGEHIHTVYGPQIIGRGLRRIRPPSERDPLFVTDHPAFNHGWLWTLLSAQEYAKPLNPGDEIDGETVDLLPVDIPTVDDPDDENAPPKPELDIEALINALPDIGAAIEPNREWQAHFKNLELKQRFASAVQHITNIKHQKLGSELTAHEIPDTDLNLEELNISDAEAITRLSRESLIEFVNSELNNVPRQALMGNFKMETAIEIVLLRAALEWIIEDRFGIQCSTGAGLAIASDEALRKLHFHWPQISDEFNRSDIVLGILERAVKI
jgi:superfamily II DNA or RNA helicase